MYFAWDLHSPYIHRIIEFKSKPSEYKQLKEKKNKKEKKMG